jgi:parvulin-like peptidyl-prolyl isomerase
MPAQGPVVDAELRPCAGAQIVAHVGADAILESEVAGRANQMVAQVVESYKEPVPPNQLEALRNQAFKQALQNHIQTRLIYLDAKKTIPDEAWKKVHEELVEQFETTELPRMTKQGKVATRIELDKKLRELGSSLEQEKRSFIETTLARKWISQQVKHDEEATLAQKLSYYRTHLREFTTPARVQYEEIMVRFNKYASKDEAYAAIARMGNQVAQGQAPFAAVAQAGSDGATAADGGRRPWTNRGSLACQAIDQELFTRQIGALSPILESPVGFHIVRVIQRENTVVKPFEEAQVDIEKKIKEERFGKQVKDYLAGLEAKTPIWTIFDGDINNPQLSRRPNEPVRR